MQMRRWFFFLAATVPLQAQAPGSVSPEDVRLVWKRPDLRTDLFDAAELRMDAALLDSLVHDLLLVVRNLPDTATVTATLRSQALGVVLRLDCGNPMGHISNGQYARGLRPAPVPVEITPTTAIVADRLIGAARELLELKENAAHRLAYLLLDLARRLDPLREKETSLFTYGTTVIWPGPADAEPPLWEALELKIMSGSVKFVTGLEQGRPVTFTVSAQAGKGKEGQKLQATLPSSLVEHMQDSKQKWLKDEMEARFLALRDMLLRRHDVWPEGWHVEFAFSADVRGGLVPQAFTGMGVVLDSMLSSQELDARCFIAGGIDREGIFTGSLQADEVIRAVAETEPGAILVLPKQGMLDIEDWLLARPSQWTLLTRLTVMRAGTLADVMAVAHAERAGKLAESFAAFKQVAASLLAAQDRLARLRTPEVIAALESITSVHPQHVNADILLRIARQSMPRHLSLMSSLKLINQIADPLLSGNRKRYPLDVALRPSVPSVFSSAAAELASLRPRLHPKCQAGLRDLLALANVLHQACGKNTIKEPVAAVTLRKRVRRALAEIVQQGGAEIR